MTYAVAPNIYGAGGVLADLGNFIQTVLGPSPVKVIQGLQNRTAMPANAAFIVMTPILENRLEWNVHRFSDSTQTDSIDQSTQIDVQIDCYGPSAGDWATILSTLLFDEVGFNLLTVSKPLYVEGPKLMPWVDAESQYEIRYMLTASLQYHPIVAVTPGSAIVVDVGLVDVEQRFPPS